MTQYSSKPRLKNDTLGDEALVSLFDAYELMSMENFRTFAEGVVMAGGGKQTRKLEIVQSMYKPGISKAAVLKKAQDFILAGMGLGV